MAELQEITIGEKNKLHITIEFDYGLRIVKNRKRKTKCTWILAVEQKGLEKIATITFERVNLSTDFEDKPISLFNIEFDRTNTDKPTYSSQLNLDFIGRDLFITFFRSNGNLQKNKLYELFESNFKNILNDFKKGGDKSVFFNFSIIR